MLVYSVEDLNNCWVAGRVIELLDDSRSDDAAAIAREWGMDMEEEIGP